MIPRTSMTLDTTLPRDHGFWTPRRDDLSEEGFGFFRDTWLIRGIRVTEARTMIAMESDLVDLADRLSSNPNEFDEVATALETADVEALPRRFREASTVAEFSNLVVDDEPPLAALELGVAGLVYALSTVGCWPAASCRGHPTPRSWSAHPAVYLASDRHRVEVLQPLVQEAGCGFVRDPGRGELLVVVAESLTEMMALASLVISARQHFVPKRGPRKRRVRDQAMVQERLWEEP